MHETFRVAYVLGVTPGKWAGIWRDRMPGHPLELVLVSPADVRAALDSGEADVALVRLPLADDSLSSIRLYDENAVVVVPKGHEIEALDSVALAEIDNPLPGDWAAAVELVAANAGVAVMPQSVARALSRRDVVARPVTDAPTTSVALAWRTTTDAVEEFIGIVRGRTANSSRGEPTPPREKPARAPKATAPRKSPAGKAGARPRFPRKKRG